VIEVVIESLCCSRPAYLPIPIPLLEFRKIKGILFYLFIFLLVYLAMLLGFHILDDLRK
jgi:hypothetical protein